VIEQSGTLGPSLKDFHELSLRLIGLADKGRFISDYYREAADILLPFFKANYVSFLANDADSYYRIAYCLDQSKQDDLAVNFVSFDSLTEVISKDETVEPSGLSLEQLETAVYRGMLVCGKFSIANGDAYFADTGDQKIATDYATVLVLKIKQQGQVIGIMSLGWNQKTVIADKDMELYQYIADIIGFSRTHRRAKFLLGERIKELKTIYKISRLGMGIGKTLEDVLADATEVIPPGFLYPDSACCKIVYANREFKSKNYQLPVYSLKADIMIREEVKGYVEVSYASDLGSISKTPFLKEEESMLKAIASELGHVAGRKEFEEERERLQQQLLHADRLATVGQLTAGVAHELNEPLNGILGFAQLIKKCGTIDQDVEKDIDKIIKASLHGREIIRKLMLFSRQSKPEKSTININERIDDGLYLLENRLKKSNIALNKEFAPDLPLIEIDPSQLNQVMVNLVVNAIQAMPGGGTLKIKTESLIGAVNIIVEDTGIGMTEEEMEKVFIPFYTTKGINEGAGLGLPVALGIVQSHGGSIDLKSEPGEGTVFTVRLPVKEEKRDG